MLFKSNRSTSHSKQERENDNPSATSHEEEIEDAGDSEREYVEKLETYAVQLKQLNDRTHPEYCKASKRIENWLSDQRLRNQILHDYRIDEIHGHYEREIRTCARDCEVEKKKIQEYLIGLCEDLKHRLEHDKKCIELTTTGDVLDLKPTVTRKLRRRAPDVSSSIIGSNIAGPTSGKFGYWGDLHLYPSIWSVTALNASAKAATELSPSPYLTVSSGQDIGGDTLSNSIVSSTTTFGNLFGSLGVNVEDGSSLLTHLIASITASNVAGNGHPDSGVLSSSGVLFTQSTFANSLGCVGTSASNSSTVTSVAANIVPSLAGLPGAQPSKRRKQQTYPPLTQLSLLLPENDIYSDLTLIHRSCGKPPSGSSSKKHIHESGGIGTSARGGMGSSNTLASAARYEETHSRRRGEITEGGRREQHHRHHHHTHNHDQHSPGYSSDNPLIWIDDGRLYIGQSCYQQGTPVYLESHGCNGTVVSVGAQDVAIKRNSDTGIMRITVQQLKLGRYVLAPLKSRQ